jgi:hypothetical protein
MKGTLVVAAMAAAGCTTLRQGDTLDATPVIADASRDDGLPDASEPLPDTAAEDGGASLPETGA